VGKRGTAIEATSSFQSARAALLSVLKELSYEEREVTLSSGQKSHFYIDCKQTVLTGEGHVLVGMCFHELLGRAEVLHPNAALPQHAACGGLTMGADPLCSSLALWATMNGRELNAIYVRKEPKGHGTGAYLEGVKAVPPGSRVVVLEDVVTTGNASLTAARRLREGGYVVDTVLTLVDREAGGREALAKEGLWLSALYSLQDLPVPGAASGKSGGSA
jgi:orotate phosphoribosyltransferase